MNGQRDFMDQTFHMLAQPVTALRATVELGLSKDLDTQGSRQVLEDCLSLLDRLMQDIAVFRELANLDEAPPLSSRAANVILEDCVEEMAIVASASNIVLSLRTDAVTLQCNEPSLRRAMFVMLDELIASSATGAAISITLTKCEDGAMLVLCPGMPPGQRQKLCHKLLQFAGGSETYFEPGRTSVAFRENSYRQYQAIAFSPKHSHLSQ